MLDWNLYRNEENSLRDFLTEQAVIDDVTDINGVLVPMRVGRKDDNDWTLPCITVYVDSETAPRLEIGSNIRNDAQIIIIDIFATNEGERLDLAKWVTDVINDGFRYYAYSPNVSNPEAPIKVAGRLMQIDFLSNNRVNLAQTVSEIDNHRHNITINAYTTGA